MKVTWLGQAGLLFETDQVKIMVDPYLSDSVKKINPKNYRRMPVNEAINMNMVDAARFAERIRAKKAVPIHTGMFDEIDVKEFPCKNRVIPEIYRQIFI